MRVIIEEPKNTEDEQIIIKCKNLSPAVLKLISAIKSQTETVPGYINADIHMLPPNDIFYFEAVDNKVFMYCYNKVYESKKKLYEIESDFQNSDFIRISKSIILNLTKIKSLTPAFNGRFEVLLENSEKVIISRQYVPHLKQKLNLL